MWCRLMVLTKIPHETPEKTWCIIALSSAKSHSPCLLWPASTCCDSRTDGCCQAWSMPIGTARTEEHHLSEKRTESNKLQCSICIYTGWVHAVLVLSVTQHRFTVVTPFRMKNIDVQCKNVSRYTVSAECWNTKTLLKRIQMSFDIS